MNDQGWAPRSNPSFSSGTRQYVWTAAREYPSSVKPLCSIVRTGALSTGWSSDSTVVSIPMSDANAASRLSDSPNRPRTIRTVDHNANPGPGSGGFVGARGQAWVVGGAGPPLPGPLPRGALHKNLFP